jgi:hypothetical protein
MKRHVGTGTTKVPVNDYMLLVDQGPKVANNSVPPESVTPQNEAIVAMAAHLGIDPVRGPSGHFMT